MGRWVNPIYQRVQMVQRKNVYTLPDVRPKDTQARNGGIRLADLEELVQVLKEQHLPHAHVHFEREVDPDPAVKFRYRHRITVTEEVHGDQSNDHP